MTPKEKAEELVDKFKIPAYVWTGNGYDVSESETLGNAKHCALIAVDEVGRVAIAYNDTQHEADYWQQVKTEIEKL